MPREKMAQVPQELTKTLLKAINDIHGREFFAPESTHLQQADLPFCKSYKLLEATELASIPPLTMYFTFNPDGSDVHKLDGSREAAMEVVKKDGSTITQELLVPYISFVLANSMAEDGHFTLVQHIDDVDFTDTPTPEQRRDVTKTLRPVDVKETDNGFAVDAHIMYGPTLYAATLDVGTDGTVEITGETPLLTDLPVRPIYLE